MVFKGKFWWEAIKKKGRNYRPLLSIPGRKPVVRFACSLFNRSPPQVAKEEIRYSMEEGDHTLIPGEAVPFLGVDHHLEVVLLGIDQLLDQLYRILEVDIVIRHPMDDE